MKKSPAFTIFVLAITALFVFTSQPKAVQAFRILFPMAHQNITTKALGDVEAEVNGKVYKFSDKAKTEVWSANIGIDIISIIGGFFDLSLPSHHFDDEKFVEASILLKDRKKEIIEAITSESPDGTRARAYLGMAFHTLQDFYSHTNWVEMQLNTHGTITDNHIDTRLGRAIFSGWSVNTPTCADDRTTFIGAGISHLTSGWYPDDNVPSGKCSHGAPFFNDDEGIHKDHAGRAHFDEAKQLAIAASIDYVNQILEAPSVAGNEKAIKALMDVSGTLAIVIDDSGSMREEINQVKAQVRSIVESVESGTDEPDDYLLVRFNDPHVNSPISTGDADQFLAEIDAIRLQNGGDCPELSQTALLSAISASDRNSTIFLFTDASAKDADEANNVNAAAQQKQISITPLLTGSCSPIDPAYISNANETGGQLFFLQQNEVDKMFDLIRPQLTGDLNTIHFASKVGDGTENRYTFPVDSTITQLIVSISADSINTIDLTDPGGNLVTPGTDVNVTTLNSGVIYTIANPETGVWNLALTTNSEFTISIKGNSPLQFNRFQFINIDEEDAHYGIEPLVGQPIVGTSQTGMADLLGIVDTANFMLLDENGDEIMTLNFNKANEANELGIYLGEFDLPDVPFRVSVQGLRGGSDSYKRIFPTLFRAQPVSVSVDELSFERRLRRGSVSTLKFKVTNFGSTSQYNMTVVANESFVDAIRPTSINLNPNEAKIIEVDLKVPVETLVGTDVLLVVTATNHSNPVVTNSSTLLLLVSDNVYLPLIFQPNGVSNLPTSTPTPVSTTLPTVTPLPTDTTTPTLTATPTPTNTPSPTPIATHTATPTPTATNTPATLNEPPNSPSRPFPNDDTTDILITSYLNWRGGDPDTGDAVTYDVYLDSNNDNPTTLICDSVQAPICFPSVNLLPNTDYYWKVVATDSRSATSTGDIWKFTTATVSTSCTVPAVPTLISPSNGSSFPSGTLAQFQWSPNGSIRSQIIIYSDRGSVINITTNNTSTNVGSPGVVRWRVRGLNEDGDCKVYGPWSDEWSLTIGSP